MRVLKQRSYSALRDVYDLYILTKDYSKIDWQKVYPIFIRKMDQKDLEYLGIDDLISEDNMSKLSKARDKSIAHQIHLENLPSSHEIIQKVKEDIHKYLCPYLDYS